MKKLVTISLIILYSFAMAGTTIAMHYCMGDMVGTSLGYNEQSACDVCHMEKHSGDDMNNCCKDENHFVKLTIDQDISVFVVSPQLPTAIINRFMFSETNELVFKISPLRYAAYIDPPDIPVYQRNCNFRI